MSTFILGFDLDIKSRFCTNAYKVDFYESKLYSSFSKNILEKMIYIQMTWDTCQAVIKIMGIFGDYHSLNIL